MRFRTAAVGLAGGAASMLLTGVAFAQAPSAPDANSATVTVVHGIPATNVDVYVDGKKALPNFAFKTVTDPISLPAGTRELEIRPAGAAAASNPILEASPSLSGGQNVSVVAHLDASGKPKLTAFPNETSAPAAGQARLVVRHTAAAPAVDVRAGGQPVIRSLTNPNEKALTVPAGQVSADVVVAGQSDPVIGPVSLNLAAGSTTVVYAIGSAQDGSLTAVTQSYGAGGMPSSVAAGSGGAADSEGTSQLPVALAAVAGLGLVGLSALRLSRR